MLPFWWAIAAVAGATEPEVPDYQTQVAPIFTKYCTGCHYADEPEGDLSLESYDDLMKGLEDGPVVLPGQAASSRLIRVLTGQAEPQMPPEDNEPPTQEEIDLLRAWVEEGAPGPVGAEPQRRLIVPKIAPRIGTEKTAVTALALSPDARRLAIARFGRVDVMESVLQEPSFTISKELPGKVNELSFASDGSRLVVSTGTAGLYGQANVYDAATGELLQTFTGHRDTLYDAILSPDGTQLATASYDRSIVLWDVETGQPLRTITGHNGAVFDLDYSPDGTVLASASADETVKLWNAATGERLDTLSQPEAEQYTVAFSPDGRYVVAGGADNRIRVWQFVSHERPQINPLRFARFAHEGAVVSLAFSPDGRTLISAAEDRTLKLTETDQFVDSRLLESQSDVVADIAVSAAGGKFVVGRMDGTWQIYPLEALHVGWSSQSNADSENLARGSDPDTSGNGSASFSREVQASVDSPAGRESATALDTSKRSESEPNDAPDEGEIVDLPSCIKGVIHTTREGERQDADIYRFTARSGETWILEVNAARAKSPLDSKIEILHAAGEPVERVLLQAVRDSYFTFRGKDSTQVNDFRLHNWEEMELNEYLYAAGEVVKLYLYPRGPDSGFIVYPGEGTRYTYFDTTALSHALNEPCYIVQPHPPGTKLVSNGLPVFPVYYANDDDGLRKWGTDSRLTFTAPADGEYLVRVTDVRGFGGPEYHYELTIRKPQPDFKVAFKLDRDTIPSGSGREFRVSAERVDGFDGEIRVDVDGLPTGFHATTPVVIQSGHIVAFGAIYADNDASEPTEENANAIKVTATAKIGAHEIAKDVQPPGSLKLGKRPKVLATIVPAASSNTTEPPRPDNDTNKTRPPRPASDPNVARSFRPATPLELTIAPGETISAKVRVERLGDFDGEIKFGKEDAGRNLPHGVYVDNIGLNGLMVTQGNTEREFFLTAADWVPETTRLFHLTVRLDGNLTTWPVLLHVRQPDRIAQRHRADE